MRPEQPPMATMNLKNVALSAASSDLGLGDQLQNQVQDDEEQQRQARLNQQRNQGALSPATLALLGSYR